VSSSTSPNLWPIPELQNKRKRRKNAGKLLEANIYCEQKIRLIEYKNEFLENKRYKRKFYLKTKKMDGK
jgi:hypothetical protein